MKRYFKRGFLIAAMFFIAVSYTGAFFSDSVMSSGNTFTAGVSSNTDIVLNEIYANPVGGSPEESAPMPDGEWIELYNTGDWTIDVNGWYLYDAAGHDLQITATNSGGGSTVIPPDGYLAVYRNADPDFSLNNGIETIYLFDGISGGGALIDTQSYSSAIEGKSWSVIPDGSENWSDNHTKSPGDPNV